MLQKRTNAEGNGPHGNQIAKDGHLQIARKSKQDQKRKLLSSLDLLAILLNGLDSEVKAGLSTDPGRGQKQQANHDCKVGPEEEHVPQSQKCNTMNLRRVV